MSGRCSRSRARISQNHPNEILYRRYQLPRDRCIVTGIDQSSKVIPGRRGDIDISHSEQRVFDTRVCNTRLGMQFRLFCRRGPRLCGLSRNRDFANPQCAHDINAHHPLYLWIYERALFMKLTFIMDVHSC